MTDQAIEAMKRTLEGDFPRTSREDGNGADQFRQTIVCESLGFTKALITSGPASDRTEKMMLYGQFIGSWDGTVSIQWSDGQRFENSCEVHFGWALAGRAIQDVWIAPARKTKAVGAEDGMYGILGDFMSRRLHSGKSLDRPVRRILRDCLGRPVGNEIIQEYRDAAGNICQWCFTDIRPDSFHWISRDCNDERKPWNQRVKFFLHGRRDEEIRLRY